jgi:hypothetical protein
MSDINNSGICHVERRKIKYAKNADKAKQAVHKW